jgi:hypothetical protein
MEELKYVIGWCKHNGKNLCKNWDGKGKVSQILGEEIVCPVQPDDYNECPFNCGPGKKSGVQ